MKSRYLLLVLTIGSFLTLASCGTAGSSSLSLTSSGDSENTSGTVSSSTGSNAAYQYSGDLPLSAEDPGVPSSSEISIASAPVKGAAVDTSAFTGTITLDDAGCTSTDSANVTIAANEISIKNTGTDLLTYYVTGTWSEGSIKITKGNTAPVKLVLDGVSIKNTTSNACSINNNSSSGADLTLAINPDSVNFLTDERTAADVEANGTKGVVVSKGAISLTGEGTGVLGVQAAGTNAFKAGTSINLSGAVIKAESYGTGFKADGDFVIADTASQSQVSVYTTYEGHGVSAGGNINISGNPVYNCVTVDPVTADNTANTYLTGGGAGLKADNDINISGGTFNIFTAGGTTYPSAHYDPADDAWDSTASEWVGAVNTKGIKAGNGNEYAADGTTVTTAGTGGDINISGGTFNLDTRDDALHASGLLTSSAGNYTWDGGSINITGGTFFISAGDDSIHADNNLTINSPDTYIDIRKSYEGLEATYINYQAGTTYLVTADDGLNAASSDIGEQWYGFEMNISGGFLFVNAAGDGLDSNGNVTVSGGFTVVAGPTDQGNGELDYGDSSSCSFTQTGGTLIAYGSGGQMDNFTASGTQETVFLKNSAVTTSQYLIVTDESGKILLAVKPVKAISTLYFSSADLTLGTYDFYAASSFSGGKEIFAGVYMAYEGASDLSYVSASSLGTATFTSSTLHVNNGTSGTGGQGWNPGGQGGPGGGH